MSSDYLLGKLSFSADETARRLGDGRYETRLISDAVMAQTGQRFLAGGLNNDYEQFRYLMDNALASKNELNLSVGVSLTSEQVAALTHDIVWMEERIVDGQKVLVPVLYLAQAESRNVRGGSLIQGRDLELIAGNDLVNVGTLQATKDLSVDVKGSLYQGGLVEANERITLMATDSIRNALAGEIRGNQVSPTSPKGPIVNDRTAVAVRDGHGMRTLVDDGGNISARDTLTIKSGNDLVNSSSISSGGDATLSATRDINLLATRNESELHESFEGGHRSVITTTVENLGSSVKSGGNLKLDAGRDLNVVASTAEAKGNLTADAKRDIYLSSAGDEHNVETHSKDGKKRVHEEDNHTVQKAAEFIAGGDVKTSSGRDTTLVASKISAGNEAYVYAGNDLNLLAAQNKDYTLYDMKEKGGFGNLKLQRDEVTQITHVGTEIKTGGNLSLVSKGDQHYQVAKLDSGKDIILDSGGSITFEGVKDLHDESHTKTNNNAAWVSAKGRGNTDETLRQTQMIAKGNIVLKAVDGLKIDIKDVNQESVSQTIDTMVKADPQLAWLKDAEARGDVDWRLVKEIHESFKYSNSGLGPASQMIIAIALAAVMGPMMAGMNTIVQAVAVTGATKLTVSTIDNRGSLGAILKDVTSKDAIKSYLVAAATAGVTQGLKFDPGAVGLDPKSLQTIALKISADAVIKTAVYGGSFQDNLASSAAGTAASIGGAIGAGKIGDLPLDDGSLAKIALHAGLGGLLSEAMGGDFRTGAIAGGANEILIGLLGDQLLPSSYAKGSAEYVQAQANILALSQIVGVLGATLSGGDVGTAAAVAANATQYNFLGDHAEAKRDLAREKFNETHGIEPAKQLVELEGADHRSDNLLAKYRSDYDSMTNAERAELNAYLQVYSADMLSQPGATKESVEGLVLKLLKEGPTTSGVYPYAGTTEAKNAAADAMRGQLDGWFDQLAWTRPKTENELIYRDAQGYLRINNEQQGLSNLGSPAIYGLTGPLGSSIRLAAAANGVLQMGVGGNQAFNGDLWNAAGNIVIGALGAASTGLPGTKLSGNATTGLISETGQYTRPTETLGLFDRTVLHVPVNDKFYERATQELLDAINAIPSNTQASKVATMISAYDPVSGKIAVGSSNGNIRADMLDVRTVNYIETQLGVKVGEITNLCRNTAGACAEVSAVDKLVRMGVNPAQVKFTNALRPRTVRDEGGITKNSIIDTCANCSVTWPERK